jgi:hypothetical protein
LHPLEITRTPADDRQHDFAVNGLLADLRKRGLVNEGYQGTTLRENLGLPVETLSPARRPRLAPHDLGPFTPAVCSILTRYTGALNGPKWLRFRARGGPGDPCSNKIHAGHSPIGDCPSLGDLGVCISGLPNLAT